MFFFGSGFSLKRVATTVFGCLSFLLPCFATFTLDPTFGSGGKVLVSFPDSSTDYSSEALGVFMQPSGRIVVGGTCSYLTSDGPMSGVAFVGLGTNGVVDTTFGTGGTVLDWRADAFTSFRDALMYPDGTILRISRFLSLRTGASSVRTVRLDPTGASDNVFASNVNIGGSGVFTTSLPAQISVRSDGKILALINVNGEFFLYRLNTDGTRDTTFGVNGINPVRFNKIPLPLDSSMEMVLLNNGKILIVGHVPADTSQNHSGKFVTHESPSKFFLARLTETGIPDKTFAGLGFAQIEFGAGLTGSVRRAILQPDGKILLCGSIGVNVFGADTDVWIARFRPNGRPDTTFGNNGIVTSDFAPGDTDVATTTALSPDNKIRIAGWVGDVPRGFLVARFSSNGSLEESTTIAFSHFAWASDITLQPDGRLLVVGSTRNPTTTISGLVFAVTRLTE